MIYELVYTSAERGLSPRSRGFCTVAATSGIPQALAIRLESLSGYRHLYPAGDRRNPVAFSHLRLACGGTLYHVLSRISDAGADYTQRSNKLAQHVAFTEDEAVPGGPLELAMRGEIFATEWKGHPRHLPQRASFSSIGAAPAGCREWGQLTGDSEWGVALAEAIGDPSCTQVTVLYSPQDDPLPLLRESWAMMPPELRWGATFGSYFMRLPPDVACRVRCVIKGTPEEKTVARDAPGGLLLDLTVPLGRAADGPWAAAARRARVPPTVASRPSTEQKRDPFGNALAARDSVGLEPVYADRSFATAPDARRASIEAAIFESERGAPSLVKIGVLSFVASLAVLGVFLGLRGRQNAFLEETSLRSVSETPHDQPAPVMFSSRELEDLTAAQGKLQENKERRRQIIASARKLAVETREQASQSETLSIRWREWDSKIEQLEELASSASSNSDEEKKLLESAVQETLPLLRELQQTAASFTMSKNDHDELRRRLHDVEKEHSSLAQSVKVSAGETESIATVFDPIAVDLRRWDASLNDSTTRKTRITLAGKTLKERFEWQTRKKAELEASLLKAIKSAPHSFDLPAPPNPLSPRQNSKIWTTHIEAPQRFELQLVNRPLVDGSSFHLTRLASTDLGQSWSVERRLPKARGKEVAELHLGPDGMTFKWRGVGAVPDDAYLRYCRLRVSCGESRSVALCPSYEGASLPLTARGPWRFPITAQANSAAAKGDSSESDQPKLPQRGELRLRMANQQRDLRIDLQADSDERRTPLEFGLNTRSPEQKQLFLIVELRLDETASREATSDKQATIEVRLASERQAPAPPKSASDVIPSSLHPLVWYKRMEVQQKELADVKKELAILRGAKSKAESKRDALRSRSAEPSKNAMKNADDEVENAVNAIAERESERDKKQQMADALGRTLDALAAELSQFSASVDWIDPEIGEGEAVELMRVVFFTSSGRKE